MSDFRIPRARAAAALIRTIAHDAYRIILGGWASADARRAMPGAQRSGAPEKIVLGPLRSTRVRSQTSPAR